MTVLLTIIGAGIGGGLGWRWDRKMNRQQAEAKTTQPEACETRT
jgi:hypothetical protein